MQNPGPSLLNVLSLLTIIPIASILANHYHKKDTVTRVMQNQLLVEEAILSGINELVIVTDSNGNILSVNDAAERILRKSRDELLHKPLLEVLFFKDIHGNVIDKQMLNFRTILLKKKSVALENLTLYATSIPVTKKVNLLIKPIPNLIAAESQLSVIVSERSQQAKGTQEREIDDEIARTRQTAMIESLKRQLQLKNPELAENLIVIVKSEQDLLMLQTIERNGVLEKRIPIDIAQLCKQICVKEQELAEGLHVPLLFDLPDFKQTDIAPLTVRRYPVTPDQLTGPFFTIQCDVKYLSLVIEKILDIALFLASGEKKSGVKVSVTRRKNNTFAIEIDASCPAHVEQHKQDLFQQYYGVLNASTNLSSASGLEGYLAKTVCSTLGIPLTTSFDKSSSQIHFSLLLEKQRPLL